LSRNLTDIQAKKINVAFLQIAGTSGQMLFEDLIEGFYVVFPGPKFELPTKLQHIEKLKSSVNIIRHVMVSLRSGLFIIRSICTINPF